MTEEKRPVGRPRTTVEDLPSEWKRIMLDCGQEGGSAVEARALLGIANSAWETLLEDSEEFRETEETRQLLCQVWWEKAGRSQVVTGKGSSQTWQFNMINRFKWANKQEITGKDGSDLFGSLGDSLKNAAQQDD